ncbi:GntR family transcriptional regulator [Hyphomonas pacifica]|uniref:Uncharacterized protein n=1 Tax=Hyphomonas pacifica TaxID=1280941 RepID=A0A062TWT1_9PROT|nr:GntR family transcriptional regulator [Hyphomonas pacifica]KCZ49046.1 hypothetical protein HY2_15515 [Hyphomonas pacifica]RAN31889.1 hypothetical protein HY3_16225 [Hyphomonas pacifica]
MKPSTSTLAPSVPEAIAKALTSDIAAERLRPGERLVEVKLAKRFDASRGSVRDALRQLEKRNLVQMQPNRGAVVVGIPLEIIADNFAVTATLIGLASRYVIQQARPDIIHEIGERQKHVAALVEAGFTPPREFATALGRFFALMITASNNRTVREMTSTLLNEASWEAMWETPCDHLTLERQKEIAGMIQTIWDHIANGNADAAERNIRLFHQSHRDAVLREIGMRRKQAIDKTRIVSFDASNAEKLVEEGFEERLRTLEEQVSRLTQADPPPSRNTPE